MALMIGHALGLRSLHHSLVSQGPLNCSVQARFTHIGLTDKLSTLLLYVAGARTGDTIHAPETRPIEGAASSCLPLAIVNVGLTATSSWPVSQPNG
jgi:hypothetical protein